MRHDVTIRPLGRLSAALLLILAGCTADDGRTPVVVYSPHGRELLETFELQFEEANPEIDVQWLDMGSQEVLDRLRSERANPQADVWWGAPSPMFVTATEQELLAPFTPSWAEALPADAKDAEGRWHGTFLTPMVIAYNTTSVDSASVPRDWDDVLAPEWTDRVLIRDPVASGGRAVTGCRIGVIVGHHWTFLFPDGRGYPGSGTRGSPAIWWSQIMATSVQSASLCDAQNARSGIVS